MECAASECQRRWHDTRHLLRTPTALGGARA